jgi:putative tricarboxylic transport membrane protein
LGISLQSGVVGGLFGLIFLVLFTEPLSLGRAVVQLSRPISPLGVLGLSVIVSLSNGSLIKGMMAATFGLMIATIGTDPLSGVTRFTFGEAELLTGIEYVIVMVGVFAMAELMMTANTPDWGKTDQNADQDQAADLRQVAQAVESPRHRQRCRYLRRRHARGGRVHRGLHVL